MTPETPPPDDNPDTCGIEPVYLFESEAIILPPGTMPPPRPPGKERPAVFRVAVPGSDPTAAEVVADLLVRVQAVIDRLAADPTGLEALRRAADALPRAG